MSGRDRVHHERRAGHHVAACKYAGDVGRQRVLVHGDGAQLKALAEKIDSCYAQLDNTMTEYDTAKRKFSED